MLALKQDPDWETDLRTAPEETAPAVAVRHREHGPDDSGCVAQTAAKRGKGERPRLTEAGRNATSDRERPEFLRGTEAARRGRVSVTWVRPGAAKWESSLGSRVRAPLHWACAAPMDQQSGTQHSASRRQPTNRAPPAAMTDDARGVRKRRGCRFPRHLLATGTRPVGRSTHGGARQRGGGCGTERPQHL